MSILKDHTIYLDITNVCGIDCAFCMYKKERSYRPIDLELGLKSKDNLSSILNDPGVKKIVISGEGEPLLNIKTIHEIVSLVDKKKVQVVTSGSVPKSPEKLKSLYRFSCLHNNSLEVRLSFDSFHLDEIGIESYYEIFETLLELDLQEGFTFRIRSLYEERENTRAHVFNILHTIGREHRLLEEGGLDDKIELKNQMINIMYKNRLMPDSDCENIYDYITKLEDKYQKPFMLGSLEFENNGLNLLIKPNGDVFFWGGDYKSFGNIHTDNLSIEYFKEIVSEHYIINKLYTVNFRKFVGELEKHDYMKDSIKKINNPYWLVKELFQGREDALEAVLQNTTYGS